MMTSNKIRTTSRAVAVPRTGTVGDDDDGPSGQATSYTSEALMPNQGAKGGRPNMAPLGTTPYTLGASTAGTTPYGESPFFAMDASHYGASDSSVLDRPLDFLEPGLCAACSLPASPALHLQRCTGCSCVEYCSAECMSWHRPYHTATCSALMACPPAAVEKARRAEVLRRTGHGSFIAAARCGDMPAVVTLAQAGFDPEEGAAGWTPVFSAALNGHMNVVRYLAEECGASLSHRNEKRQTAIYFAAQKGNSAIVRYLAKKTPALVDLPDTSGVGITPLMLAAFHGNDECVRHLARLGCRLNRGRERLALGLAQVNDQLSTVRLLSDIDAAGGWRGYAAGRRMVYARIRYQVSRTYVILPETESAKDRMLYHFLFGRNGNGNGNSSSNPFVEYMLTLPGDVFGRVIGYLES